MYVFGFILSVIIIGEYRIGDRNNSVHGFGNQNLKIAINYSTKG